MTGRLKEIYLKHRELITYVFFGGLTTLVSIVSQFAADYLFQRFSPDFLGATTVPATTVSWICAVTFAFFVNKIFVFKSKSNWLKQAVTFYGARLTTYFLEMGFMVLTVDILEFNYVLMKVLAQVFVLIGNYLLSKFWIFKKK